ncbi:hypothetical protein AAFF_G00133940 [Aldrovandia affinis]|uniref:Uncharacterized protein n=1 Tax=Aldrovandia affinis TaxID=143900 RepID=A0AAD7RQN4_9TELE|nr:hypothetical protein AAFF_G00133940 [Aldrovandia affinis]
MRPRAAPRLEVGGPRRSPKTTPLLRHATDPARSGVRRASGHGSQRSVEIVHLLATLASQLSNALQIKLFDCRARRGKTVSSVSARAAGSTNHLLQRKGIEGNPHPDGKMGPAPSWFS